MHIKKSITLNKIHVYIMDTHLSLFFLLDLVSLGLDIDIALNVLST